ncbi:MAG: DUF3592 domain-containing protein [Fimbriiglobus sp.]
MFEVIFVLGLFGVFYLVGFYLLWYAVWNAWRSRQAAKWPITPGTVSHVEVIETPGEDTYYQVKVEYHYSVDGEVYQGSNLAFGYFIDSEREYHEAIYERLKQAKTVGVRYHPKQPSRSCLSFGIHPSIRLYFFLSLLWLSFFTGGFVLLFVTPLQDKIIIQNVITL